MAMNDPILKALELPGGARFYKCALQVNPFEYLQRHQKQTKFVKEEDYNSAIIDECKRNGIEVIAVTDHYRVKSGQKLIKAAREAGIYGFPGFEAFTKDGVHFLCLFDPGELERMFQASGRIQYGLKPVPGSSLDNLDRRRLKDYLGRVLGSSYPSDENAAEWERLLLNMDLLIKSDDLVTVTIDGMLLFGKNPKRFIPQSGIRAIAYPGDHPDYATRADQDLKGAMTPLFSQDGAILEPSLLESSLVEQALDFIKRNTEVTAHLEGGARRVDRPSYPEEVLREVIVNSLVHRDYSIAGTDISLNIFADRLEVRSPGPLPNTVTVDGLKVGLRYARNQTLVNVMRDYRYVDFRGMGIRQKVIPGMFAHNGTEPDFIADERSFTVRLWKENQSR
ncbi:MAG: ATP-binding protein [Deltaproteobacteria bacterium]|nr:ATP-binding protein [Deltaproteobacteria bacterium]